MTSSNGNFFCVTGHLCGEFTGPLICVWMNCWVNNNEAGDLRRYCGHYDVTVMLCVKGPLFRKVFPCHDVIMTSSMTSQHPPWPEATLILLPYISRLLHKPNMVAIVLSKGYETWPPIVLFHKSQCALRYLDLMSKIQNISSHLSLGTCLTVTANEQNGDWPAPVSRVSVQPVIGWLKYEVARQWSHIVHRPGPHGNVTLPMRS